MLLITRREAEAIVINGQIHVKIMEIKGGRVKLGFEFPVGNTVYREELFTKIQAENRAAANTAATINTALPVSSQNTANKPPLAQVLLNLPRTTAPSDKEGKSNEHHHKPASAKPNAGGSDDE